MRCDDCDDVTFDLPWAQKGNGKCSRCHGTGSEPEDLPLPLPPVEPPCRRCGGSGVCPTCDGEGIID